MRSQSDSYAIIDTALNAANAEADAVFVPPADKARALRAMFDRGRENALTFAGAYATGASSYACGNTHGVRRYCTATVAGASVIAIGGSASGYAAGIARDGVDVVALGDEAIAGAALCAGSEATI